MTFLRQTSETGVPCSAAPAVCFVVAVDSRLTVRREGRILAAQEAPPSPVILRKGHERSATVPLPPSGANGLGERWTATLKPQESRAEDEKDQGAITTAQPLPGRPQ